MSTVNANEKAVAEVMKKTGWSREHTVASIEDAKQRTGITYAEYNKHNFHTIPITEQGAKFRKILESDARKKLRKEKKNAMCIAKIMTQTGWDYEYAEERVLEARSRVGCTYREFLAYRFWDLEPEVQSELYLTCMAVKVLKKWNANPELINVVLDKGKCNEFFSEYIKRQWCINTEITEKEFVKKFAKSKKIIYKPIEGIKGYGVESFEISSENARSVYEKLAQLPRGVVEEYIIQHPTMSKLCPTSVNTVRIVTFNSKSKPITPDGKYVDIAYASVRCSSGLSVVDNYSSGGLIMGADLETGCIVTDGINEMGSIFKAQPVTGTVFKGFKIPYFKEALDMVVDACERKNVEGCLGWDIAISENGPVLVEVNHNPGSGGITAPFVTEKKGMKHVMEKYM